MSRIAFGLRPLAVLLPLALAFQGGCVDIGTQERRIIVLDGGPVAERARAAARYVSSDTLHRLRASVRARFPDVNEVELAELEVSWQRMPTNQSGEVMIVVMFAHPDHARAKAISDYVAARVQEELSQRGD